MGCSPHTRQEELALKPAVSAPQEFGHFVRDSRLRMTQILEQILEQLVIPPPTGYIRFDFGRAENRFPRRNSGEEESPNTEGRDAA